MNHVVTKLFQELDGLVRDASIRQKPHGGMAILELPAMLGSAAGVASVNVTDKRERRLVRKEGLDPPIPFRVPDPKSGASASSATFAQVPA